MSEQQGMRTEPVWKEPRGGYNIYDKVSGKRTRIIAIDYEQEIVTITYGRAKRNFSNVEWRPFMGVYETYHNPIFEGDILYIRHANGKRELKTVKYVKGTAEVEGKPLRKLNQENIMSVKVVGNKDEGLSVEEVTPRGDAPEMTSVNYPKEWWDFKETTNVRKVLNKAIKFFSSLKTRIQQR